MRNANVPHLGGLLDDDVLNKEFILVKTVDLSVSLSVLDQSQQELGGPKEHSQTSLISSVLIQSKSKKEWEDLLDGPSTLNNTVNLGLSGTTDGTVVATERNASGVGLNVLKELDSLDKGQSLEGSGGLTVRFQRPSMSSQLTAYVERMGKDVPRVLVVNTEVRALRDTHGLAVLDEVGRGVLGLFQSNTIHRVSKPV